MSNEARHRDIAALLARGVIRVKQNPLAAKAIESHIAAPWIASDAISDARSRFSPLWPTQKTTMNIVDVVAMHVHDLLAAKRTNDDLPR